VFCIVSVGTVSARILASPALVFTYQRKTSKPPMEGSKLISTVPLSQQTPLRSQLSLSFSSRPSCVLCYSFLLFFSTPLLTSLQTSFIRLTPLHRIVQKNISQDGRRSYTERSPRAETLDGCSHLLVDASSSRSRLHTSKA
jgi:hypothetical protein